MLKIGKTYRLTLRGGLDVDIVGSGSNDNQGQFFVGIARNDMHGDWSGIYRPDGTRIWDTDHVEDIAPYNLIVPVEYVSLRLVLNVVQNDPVLVRRIKSLTALEVPCS